MNVSRTHRPSLPDQVLHQAEWRDVNGQPWTVTLTSESIVLHGRTATMEVPRKDWLRDVFISQHGSRYLIRFENFDHSLPFLLEDSAAAPLAALLMAADKTSVQERNREADATDEAPLLWPKVSPLAVWALLCSAFAFIPVVGVIPAIATIILLIIHRVSVRRTRAYLHSRRMCAVAFVFLMVGAAVSVASTMVAVRNFSSESWQPFDDMPDDKDWIEAGPVVESAASMTIHPDRIHASSLAIFDRLRNSQINWGMALLGIAVIVISLSFHECAHAISAWWLGDDFARRNGRVTLNPLSHIDPFGTFLLPLILTIAGVAPFGFARPVPVIVEHLHRPRRAHILISLAGPGSNILLACASLMLLLGIGSFLSLWYPDASAENFPAFDMDLPVQASGFPLAYFAGPFFTFLILMFVINVVLAVFNMIPVPPLDGSWVLENLFPRTLGRLYERIRPFSWIVFLGLFYVGAFSFLMAIPLAFILGPGFLLLRFCTSL